MFHVPRTYMHHELHNVESTPRLRSHARKRARPSWVNMIQEIPWWSMW